MLFSPEIALMVEADSVRAEEGNIGELKHRIKDPETRGPPVPPGSQGTARKQGLPRNLGDPVVSAAGR